MKRNIGYVAGLIFNSIWFGDYLFEHYREPIIWLLLAILN